MTEQKEDHKAGKKFPKLKFTPFDDLRLRNLINPNGINDWEEIAKKMKNRNARQCRDRWEYYLSPHVNNGPWTHEEDVLLFQKYNEYGTKWTTISRFFRGRTNTCCKNRWLLLKRMAEKAEKIAKQQQQKQEQQKDEQLKGNSLFDIETTSLFDEDVDPFESFREKFNDNGGVKPPV